MTSPDISRPRRRPTVSVDVGGVLVGSAHPVVVQSMTNTDTADAAATADQVSTRARRIAAGSGHGQHRRRCGSGPEMVARSGRRRRRPDHRRLSLQRPPAPGRVPGDARARSPNIASTRATSARSVTTSTSRRSSRLPLTTTSRSGSASIGARSTRQLLTELDGRQCARGGPAGRPRGDDRGDDRARCDPPSWRRNGLGHDRIIISAKVSGVQDLVDTYRLLAPACDYPLHLGLTEAGMGMKGIVAFDGWALAASRRGDRRHHPGVADARAGRRSSEEVQVAQQVLQSLGLRSFPPQVSACPGCGRTTSTFFQEMAPRHPGVHPDRMPEWKPTHPGVEEMKVAVMGCVVNGPGESKHADIGIRLPGTFEEPIAPVYVDGQSMTDTARRPLVASSS